MSYFYLSRQSRLSLCFSLIAAVLVTTWGGSVWADSVKYTGITRQDITIKQVKGDQIAFQLPNGTLQEMSIGAVQSLHLAAYPEMEAAYKLYNQKQYEKAAKKFKGLWMVVKEPGVKEIIGIILVRTYDQMRQSELAVQAYLQLVKYSQVDSVLYARPTYVTNLEEERQKSFDLIKTEIEQTKNPAVLAVLRQLSDRFAKSSEDRRLELIQKQVDKKNADAGVVIDELEIKRDTVRRNVTEQFDQKQYKEALKIIDQGLSEPEVLDAAFLIYNKARCLAGLKQPKEAIMTFMSLLIGYEGSEFHHDGLKEIGHLFVANQQVTHARRVWLELEGRAKQAEDQTLLAEAKVLLKSVKK